MTGAKIKLVIVSETGTVHNCKSKSWEPEEGKDPIIFFTYIYGNKNTDIGSQFYIALPNVLPKNKVQRNSFCYF